MSPNTRSPWLRISIILSHLLGRTTALKPPINTTITPGTDSDDYACRTCPWTLCNVKVPDIGHSVIATCWTHGDTVNGKNSNNDGDNIWMKTDKGCYMSNYDLVYNGTAEEDLDYCGKDSEEKTYTKHPVDVKYDADCWTKPFVPTVDDYNGLGIYYKPGSSVEVVCWFGTRHEPLSASRLWLRTIDGCLILESMLEERVELGEIERCWDYPSSSQKETTNLAHRTRDQLQEGVERRWLRNGTVGGEVANCYSGPRNSSRLIRSYDYGEWVTIQCITPDYETPDPWAVAWGLTLDWCYVDERDMEDAFRDEDTAAMPLCEKFGQIDTSKKPKDDGKTWTWGRRVKEDRKDGESERRVGG